MTSRATAVLTLASLALATLCLGCGPEADVFDKAAIDRVRTITVVPPPAPQEPTAGPIVSGMLTARLRAARYKDLEVVMPPVLWRLQADSGRPAAQLVDRSQAVAIGRQLGADAVLTGTVNYSINLVFPPGLPKAILDMKASEFKNKFATRVATAWVKFVLVRVRDDRDLYVNTGQAKGDDNSELIARAVDEAIKPLERHLAARK